MRMQELSQVARHRWVGCIGQPEFLETTFARSRCVGQFDFGEKPVQQHTVDFCGTQFDLQTTADQFGSFGGQVDCVGVGSVVRQHGFFDAA